MVGEDEHRAEIGSEILLPGGQAAQVVARGPVLPVLMVLVARREPAAFHVDEPRCLAGRGDDEIQALERTIGDEAATRFVHGDVRQTTNAEKSFERGFVVIVAVHES